MAGFAALLFGVHPPYLPSLPFLQGVSPSPAATSAFVRSGRPLVRVERSYKLGRRFSDVRREAEAFFTEQGWRRSPGSGESVIAFEHGDTQVLVYRQYQPGLNSRADFAVVLVAQTHPDTFLYRARAWLFGPSG
jgi:hypothetical protein